MALFTFTDFVEGASPFRDESSFCETMSYFLVGQDFEEPVDVVEAAVLLRLPPDTEE